MNLRPWYNKDANYQTNAKSFMDYLARTNKFLDVLIEDYENFQELVIEELERIKFDSEEAVDDILVNWLEDGTLEQIINNDILGNKADKVYVDELNENLTTHIKRLDQKDEHLTSQMSQSIQENRTYIDNQLNQLNGLELKGAYSTLQELRSAYPNGAQGIFVVQETGHWYYWNGSWSDGGLYQAMPWDEFMTENNEEWVV